MSYGSYVHPDGAQCIWMDDTREWFVPLDAGGEGYTCEKEHPLVDEVEALRQQVRELEEMVDRFTTAVTIERRMIWIDPEDGTHIVWTGNAPPPSCIPMKRYVTDWKMA